MTSTELFAAFESGKPVLLPGQCSPLVVVGLRPESGGHPIKLWLVNTVTSGRRDAREIFVRAT